MPCCLLCFMAGFTRNWASRHFAQTAIAESCYLLNADGRRANSFAACCIFPGHVRTSGTAAVSQVGEIRERSDGSERRRLSGEDNDETWTGMIDSYHVCDICDETLYWVLASSCYSGSSISIRRYGHLFPHSLIVSHMCRIRGVKGGTCPTAPPP